MTKLAKILVVLVVVASCVSIYTQPPRHHGRSHRHHGGYHRHSGVNFYYGGWGYPYYRSFWSEPAVTTYYVKSDSTQQRIVEILNIHTNAIKDLQDKLRDLQARILQLEKK